MRDDVRIARETDLPAPADDATYVEKLRRIHVWLASWAEIARTVVTRRDALIRLGLAKRRLPKPKKPPSPPPAVVGAVAPLVARVVPIAAVAEERGPDSRAA